MGRPIGGPSGYSPRHSVSVAQTVVSVGPYALMKRRPLDQRCTISELQLSPAEMIVCRSGRSEASSTANSDGGSVTTVIARSRKAFVASLPSHSDARLPAKQSVPPVSKAIMVSQTDASKLNDENCSTRLPSPT